MTDLQKNQISSYTTKESFFSSEEITETSSIIDDVENLFLMGRFREALDLSISELERVSNKPNLLKSDGKQSSMDNKASEQQRNKLMSTHVIRLVALVIQILFELNRHSEVMDFVMKVYGTTTERLPFQIFLLILNLQISLGNLDKAKRMVIEHLRYRRNADPPDMSRKGKEKQDKYEALTQIQYSSIAELYVMRILIPLRNFEEAKAFLSVLEGKVTTQKMKYLIEELDDSVKAIKEAERLREARREDLEDEEIKVERHNREKEIDGGRDLDGEEEEGGIRYGGRKLEEMGEEEEEEEEEREDDDAFMARQSYAYRMSRMKGSEEELRLSKLKTQGTFSAASMVTQWASGLWQWAAPIQNGGSSSTMWVCVVVSFVLSFFFLYMRKDVLSRLSNIFGNLKELLTLAFNIDRSVTGSNMMRRRRLQR